MHRAESSVLHKAACSLRAQATSLSAIGTMPSGIMKWYIPVPAPGPLTMATLSSLVACPPLQLRQDACQLNRVMRHGGYRLRIEPPRGPVNTLSAPDSRGHGSGNGLVCEGVSGRLRTIPRSGRRARPARGSSPPTVDAGVSRRCLHASVSVVPRQRAADIPKLGSPRWVL
jgi:hypothetical protein